MKWMPFIVGCLAASLSAAPMPAQGRADSLVVGSVLQDVKATLLPDSVKTAGGRMAHAEVWAVQSQLCLPHEAVCLGDRSHAERFSLVTSLLDAKRVGVDSTNTPQAHRITIALAVVEINQFEATVRVKRNMTSQSPAGPRPQVASWEYFLKAVDGSWRIESKKATGGS